MAFNATEKKMCHVLVASGLARGGSCVLSLAIATLTMKKRGAECVTWHTPAGRSKKSGPYFPLDDHSAAQHHNTTALSKST